MPFLKQFKTKIVLFNRVIKNSAFIKWFTNFTKQSTFWFPLVLSTLSALIFYYFINYIPRQRDINKIKPQIEFITDKILWDGMFIVTEMTHQNISQNKYYDGSLTLIELENALRENFFDTKMKYDCYNLKSNELYNIGGFVSDYLSNINKNIGVLLRYIIYLDPEFLNIINELQRNILFESWDNSRAIGKINFYGGLLKPVRNDISEFKICVFEFYKTLQKLEKYVDENYYSKLKSLQIKASRAYFSKKYKLAIEFNLKILEFNKYDKDAMFYLGASFINDYQISRGIKILKEGLGLYPDLEQFIKSNIENEYAKKKIFENSK